MKHFTKTQLALLTAALLVLPSAVFATPLHTASTKPIPPKPAGQEHLVWDGDEWDDPYDDLYDDDRYDIDDDRYDRDDVDDDRYDHDDDDDLYDDDRYDVDDDD